MFECDRLQCQSCSKTAIENLTIDRIIPSPVVKKTISVIYKLSVAPATSAKLTISLPDFKAVIIFSQVNSCESLFNSFLPVLCGLFKITIQKCLTKKAKGGLYKSPLLFTAILELM